MAESGAVKEDDIPFGARALESGIEVSGIWVSNHNSPVPTPRLAGTPEGTRPSTPRFEKPQSSTLPLPNTSGSGHTQNLRRFSNPSPKNVDANQSSAIPHYALDGGSGAKSRDDIPEPDECNPPPQMPPGHMDGVEPNRRVIRRSIPGITDHTSAHISF